MVVEDAGNNGRSLCSRGSSSICREPDGRFLDRRYVCTDVVAIKNSGETVVVALTWRPQWLACQRRSDDRQKSRAKTWDK